MAGWRRHERDERMRGFLVVKAKEMREAMTGAEAALSALLDDTWLRQEPLCSAYIADFVHMPSRLVVEVDGGYHMEAAQVYMDKRRDRTMEAFSFEVMRFTNEQVMADLPGTVAAIEAKRRHILATRYVPRELPGRIPPKVVKARYRRKEPPRKPLGMSGHRTTKADLGE